MGDCTGMDEVEIGELRRDGRKCCAKDFRRDYTSSSNMEQKTCIWSRNTYSWSGEFECVAVAGDATVSYVEKSSGITWVGVHGMNSICVVTRIGDLDVRRVRSHLKHSYVQTVLRSFMKTVISEIEDLADPSSRLRQSFGQSIEKPFGIVSVIPGPKEASLDGYESDEYEEKDEFMSNLRKALLEKDKISRQPRPGYDETKTVKYLLEKMKSDSDFIVNETLQASSVEYDEKKAIEFLKEKMRWDATFTIDETIQTAISAFQHLFQKKFKANAIEVTVMDPNYFEYVNRYSVIEKHLAVINGLDSSEAP